MERIECKLFWLFCLDFVDVLVGSEAFEGLEPPSKVVSCNKVGKVVTELVVDLIVEALDGCFLDRPVHAFDLALCPRMLGLREPLIDISFSASAWKCVVPKKHFASK